MDRAGDLFARDGACKGRHDLQTLNEINRVPTSILVRLIEIHRVKREARNIRIYPDAADERKICSTARAHRKSNNQ